MTTIEGLRQVRDGLDKLWKKERQRAWDLKERVVELEAEVERLKAIEHAAWHLLNESEDCTGPPKGALSEALGETWPDGMHMVCPKEFKALSDLLPEDHPTR